MNVLVFGASGATGREVVGRALGLGHAVTAFVRDPSRFGVAHPRLAVVAGDVTQRAPVERAVGDADAVVSALGSGNSLGPHPELVDGVRNMVRAMQSADVRRLVYLSMLGVGGSARQLGLVDRYVVLPLLLRNVRQDHAAKEAWIVQSDLEWVIVRPPRLTNEPRTGRYRSGEDVTSGKLLASITRADLADFMLEQLTDDRYLHRAPGVLGGR